MSVFSVLVIGHLIADFPLQTPTILRWKFRGGVWILPHIVIHTAVMGLLFKNLFVVFVIFLSHYLIDWTKVSFDNSDRKGVSFIIDQSAHMLVLLALAQFAGINLPQFSFDYLPVILMLAVLSAVFMFLNVVKSQLADSPFPKIVSDYAFHVSKVSGWAAAIGLVLTTPILR
jgi:hypothetical protein